MMRSCFAMLLVIHIGLIGEQAKSQALDERSATKAFTEAQELSEQDGGKLWGKPLYGPMVFVDTSTGLAVANEVDAQGTLQKHGSVWQGELPENIPVANTAFDWHGKRWTMMQWPLPQTVIARRRLLAHEMFHRIEPSLGVPTKDAVNSQLDLKDGRLWMLLEWRALAAALAAQSDLEQQSAIADAVLFRRKRQQLFPGSFDQERALELNEGLAEYTGVVLSEPDPASARWHAIARLADPTATQSLVRSFAYTSGPAYGLLLDKRRTGWKKQIDSSADLATLLAATMPRLRLVSAERAKVYGGEALQFQETERKQTSDALRARYRKLLVTGPTLTLPITDNLNFGFDPGDLVPLDDEGTVYPTLHATDDWGTLEVTQGALVSFPKKVLRVAAPAAGEGIAMDGPGWQLKIAAGWVLAPADNGSFVLRRKM